MTGTLTGVLDIQWGGEDQFIYIPDTENPLTYTNGALKVQPTRGWTDGGSIPRIFWPLPGLSPWCYGPAYALHDFVYNEHRCGRPLCTFEQANAMLGDCIDILIAKGAAPSHGDVKAMILSAVGRFGWGAWSGACVVPPAPRKLMAAHKTVLARFSL